MISGNQYGKTYSQYRDMERELDELQLKIRTNQLETAETPVFLPTVPKFISKDTGTIPVPPHVLDELRDLRGELQKVRLEKSTLDLRFIDLRYALENRTKDLAESKACAARNAERMERTLTDLNKISRAIGLTEFNRILGDEPKPVKLATQPAFDRRTIGVKF